MIQIEVELVEHSPGAPWSGIGRYTRMLYRHFPSRVSARLTTQIDPPLARYSSFFHHLPVGVRRHRPGSIVHFMEDLGSSQMLWRPVRPAIATSHDLGMLVWPQEGTMHRPPDRIMWHLSYLGLKRMDAVIAVSEFSRRMVIKRLRIPPERVFAVQSGVDASRFRPVPHARAEIAARYGLRDSAEDKYLLYVGTEIPRKNLVTIFKAMARLPGNIRLLKVGDPGHWRFRAATDRVLRELELEDRVIFVDEVTEDELILLYNAADVYICSSFLEGFGLPVLEAMACGTPVVCSNASSLPEVAGEAAILVPPADDRLFAEAIMSVLSNEGLSEQMKAKGLKRAGLFTWSRTAGGVVSVYEEVARRRSTRHSDGRASGPRQETS